MSHTEGSAACARATKRSNSRNDRYTRRRGRGQQFSAKLASGVGTSVKFGTRSFGRCPPMFARAGEHRCGRRRILHVGATIFGPFDVLATFPARSIIRAKPAVVNSEPRSDVNFGSCSRCSRRRARNSSPRIGCVLGVPCLTLRTCTLAVRNPAKQHLPQTSARHSMLPRIDKKRDDGLFAKRLGGLQPVQTLNEYEARAVRSY